MAKLNTQSQVLSLHALLYFSVSLSLSVFFFTSPHPFFFHSCYFSSLSPLCSHRAFGCLSSSDRASGSTFWQAVHSKTPGHEDRPTLSLSHTHISVCTCTLESQPSMNKSEAGPGSWLLEEIAEGTGNPQLNTGSHGVLMTSEWRELHSTTSTADAKKTQRPAKCKRSLEPKWVLKASWER